MMRIVLFGLLLAVRMEWSWCQDTHFTSDGDIRDFAVTINSVYVVTEGRLYHLSLNLTSRQSLFQRGIFVKGKKPEDARFDRVSEEGERYATFRVTTLVPFVNNGSLITCGVIECGYCELRDLTDIYKLLYMEHIEVGPIKPNTASVEFLVDLDLRAAKTYILTALESYKEDTCYSLGETVKLQNTNDEQRGKIFSSVSSTQTSTPSIMMRQDKTVQFVDGFQIDSTIYLFSNVHSKAEDAKIRLIWLKSGKSKSDTLKSLQGAKVTCGWESSVCQRLLSSSVVPGGPAVLWAGVFAGSDPTKTALVIFNISHVQTKDTNKDPDFRFSDQTTSSTDLKRLVPEKVLFQHSFMTSVLAVRQKSWMVFFIGTGDGQLIKLAVDKAFGTVCPRVLYRADDDRQVFPKMHLDPVDRKHVFVALRNQLRRVPVSQCKTYTSWQDCLSMQDPYCGWCDYNPSRASCTFEDECPDGYWLSISDDTKQQEMISYQVNRSNMQITLTIQTHLTVNGASPLNNLTCQLSTSVNHSCVLNDSVPPFPKCSCILPSSRLPAKGLDVTVNITIGSVHLIEQLTLNNCFDITGTPSSLLCQHCIASGCGWINNTCSWVSTGAMDESVCQTSESELDKSKPEIFSITPSVLSFYGKNHALLTGRNLSHVTKVRLQGDMDCSPKESPVWNNTGFNLTFHIPGGDKGLVNVCVLLPDGSCHGKASIMYRSSPACTMVTPTSTWKSGNRIIMVQGSNLEFVDGFVHSHSPDIITLPRNTGSGNLSYGTPPSEDARETFTSNVSMRVANQTLACLTRITYRPDPQFITFTSTRTGDDLRITIQKKADELQMDKTELSVWGIQGDKQYECIMETIETSNGTDFVICEIRSTPVAKIQSLKIKYGNVTVGVEPPSSFNLFLIIPLVLLPILCIIVAVVYVHRRQQRQLTAQMNRLIEDLELDIRNDIRQGFVDLQTEKADLIENVGAIPFLDYKHFASRIFFPEGGTLMTSFIRDIGQDALKVETDECCQALSRLIQDQLFVTSMVHALEEEKTFTVKDKCAVASLLTVALHSDLDYLTKVMEDLLTSLMEQPSNAQPKLLLRRTESIVEKLLTNWMSISLYGFLRESVGQHLFLLVSALTQHIAMGPVDSVTEKALYTLNEDWLLWQAQDFTSMKLKVLFAVGSDGEVSEPLEVTALSCDTVEQLKEKILTTFKAKFGFPYNIPVRNIQIAHEKEGVYVPLEEVDASSEVLGEVTMLNTLKHYKVSDGESIKVLSRTHPPLSPQGSLKDDQDFSVKYFHLIDPDVDEDQMKNPARKKLKLKEVHLTKLLSTKVAVHSFVENLFRAIWGTPHSRAPHAIKYFFDFLDVQADNMKITDPDVLHIWKTNSLPLRFWVNILKNPQFVFDMEKTPHLDSCLSVITQAFMDSFSLTEMQLGKHAPTNKLLYAKDIPQFKQEVKSYYKQVRDQPPITSSEFKGFLLEESKKHENEFNESAALRELYKFIERYFTKIKEKLDQNGVPAELIEQLKHVKNLFDGLKSCSWN
ncbi:plexin-C1 [Polymixia lowei]